MKNLLMLLILLLSTPACGQDEGFGKELRPLSTESASGREDAEMRDLVLRFFEMTPCGNFFTDYGLCPEARAILIAGGDRAARYLEKQAELNLEEGRENQWTYFLAIGYTESDEAVRYLSRRADTADPEERGMFERCLAETRRPELTDRWLKHAEGEDRDLQSLGLGALEKIQRKHGPQPGVRERLERARARLPAEEVPLAQRFDAVLGR